MVHQAAQKVGEKVKDAHVTEGIATFGSKALDKTKEIGHKVADGTKTAFEGTKMTIDNIKKETQEKGGVVNYAKVIGQSGINSAKTV